MFSELEEYLQKDLLNFIRDSEKKKPETMGEWWLKELIKHWIAGDCEITGYATGDKKCFVEYSWWKDAGTGTENV